MRHLMVVFGTSLLACGTDPAPVPFCAAVPISDAFIELGASGGPCDDGDPCTDDHCDRVLDRCVNVAHNPQAACTRDDHCDDGQACTEDVCEVDGCGNRRCVNVTIEGCQPCDLSVGLDCDDGNDCTRDRCVGGECTFEVVAECEMLCGRAQWRGSRWVPDPALDGYGFAVGAAGVLSRPGAPCPTVDACACQGDLAVGHTHVVPTEGEPFACAVDRCADGPAVTTCDVLIARRVYAAWGHASDDALTLEGFCLTMTNNNLFGHWAGTLVLGEVVLDVRARGELVVDGGQTRFGFVPTVACDDCGYTLAAERIPTVFTAQALTSTWPILDPSGKRLALAGTLYPSGHTLRGTLVDGDTRATLRLELVDPTL